jgi:DNA-binding winged helix-turn-helix (wHTH) protein/tetratricopeptide (TPR) repeat protein
MVDRTEFHFDGWTLIRASGELVRDGNTQRLPQQPLRMLVELLEHAGQVVTRERMVEVLWPKGVVDFDNSLNAVVRKLRVALGDNPDAPRYIETLPRIGYRFVGKLDAAAPATPVGDSAAAPAAQTAVGPNRHMLLGGIVGGAMLLIAGIWSLLPPASAPAQVVAPAVASEPRRTTNQKAYELYLRGIFHRSRRDADGTQSAIESFEAALREDPHFADAWSAVSETYSGATIRQSLPAADGIERARNAALRAVELAPDSASAHTALGLVHSQFDRDYAKAEQDYQRARGLDPGYARLWHHYGMLRVYQNRLDDALAYIGRAREMEPTMLLYASNYGAVLYYKRDYDAAIAHTRTLLSTQPRLDQARIVLIRALAAKGDIDAALEQLPLRYFDRPIMGDDGMVYALAGRRAEALQQVERLERHARQGLGLAYEIAVIHLALGDIPRACEALARAPDDHSNWMGALRVDPRMDSLRMQPCYAEIHQRVYGAGAR